jgi:diguanylate cyclase (GGDEF)-like protein
LSSSLSGLFFLNGRFAHFGLLIVGLICMNKKILLIDNIAPYRAETATQLRALDFEVHEAGGVSDALDKARSTQYDLVVADNDLQERSGAALLFELRGFNPSAKTVLVVEPSFDIKSEAEAVKDIFRIIKGPLPPHSLVAKLDACLKDDLPKENSVFNAPEPLKSASSTPLMPLPNAGFDAAVDAHVKEVRRNYQSKLPAELRKLKEAIVEAQRNSNTDSLKSVHALAHTIHGTAGTLGFQEVSDIAGEIDIKIKRFLDGALPGEEDWDEIFKAFRRAETVPDRLSLVISVEPHTSNIASVLVVDSDESSMAEISALGHSRCIDIKPAFNRKQALDWAASGRMDGVILDLASCMGKGHIVECIDRLRRIPEMQNTPIALMSEDCSVDNRVAAAHAGATHFLQKPLLGDELADIVQQFVVARAESNHRVLVVDDDEPFREHIAAILREEGFFVATLSQPKRIFEKAEAVNPDIILLDVMMPDISGFDVCRMLRSAAVWKDVPILFLTAESAPKARLECFRAGGDDYIEKPVLKEELLARIGVRLERTRLYKDRADKDALTSLLSRRAFIEMFKIRIAEGLRYDRPVSLCLLDIDRFKHVNDTYGHLAGDRVLAGLGKLLESRFRATDVRGRWGGEEFTVVFYGEDRSTAAMILTRVLEEFSRMEFEGDKGEKFFCTFSCGVAELSSDGSSTDELFRTADERLYAAKKAGRNRIVVQ